MIESSLYNKIIDLIPVICVDGFIIKDYKILLLKRKNYPAIKEWWVPGGRVLKNERLTDAIIRKVKEETGFSVLNFNRIGITETIFEKKHTINVCYEIEVNDDIVSIDSDHSEYKWFDLDKIPSDLNSELTDIIKIIKNKK